jgi:sec-independent protein translocase protein TatC
MAPQSRRGKDREARMSLGEHLRELRKRLFFTDMGILIGTILGWLLSDYVFVAMQGPIDAIAAEQGRQANLNYTDITSAFDLKLKVAFTVGVIVSSPVWLYQIWSFLVPGLTRAEVKYAVGFIVTAIPLFLTGCAAGWFVLPNVVRLLTGFAPNTTDAFITATNYFDFVLKLVVAIGVGFVLPVFLVVLNFVGVISGRTILKSWRIAVVVIVLFTAIVTPAADIFSMFLLAIPMIILYFVATVISMLHDRRLEKRALNIEVELAHMSTT